MTNVIFGEEDAVGVGGKTGGAEEGQVRETGVCGTNPDAAAEL